jgi:Transglycosylase SLT domain
MRPILAAAFLLLGLSHAATEPEIPSVLPGSVSLASNTSSVIAAKIKPARPKSDREAMVTPSSDIVDQASGAAAPAPSPAPSGKNSGPAHDSSPTPPANSATTSNGAADQQTPGGTAAPQTPNSPSGTSGPATGEVPNSSEAASAAAVPLDRVCNAIMTSAQDNDLPVPFFANLIWQESRLRDNAVSPKGALGIAQFMPKVALASGLENPFDPVAALAASARLLSGLRDQFGNLGFVAAAYNAGTKRVMEWLHRDRTLPRETRGYVIDVTGRSVEQWKKKPPDDANLRFTRRLPCRDLPQFAELEQTQTQQAQEKRAIQQVDADPPAQRPTLPVKGRLERRAVRNRVERVRWIERKLHRPRLERAWVRTDRHEEHRAEREEVRPRFRHAERERHRRV